MSLGGVGGSLPTFYSSPVQSPVQVHGAAVTNVDEIQTKINDYVKGIILSGGPLNVYEINKYSFDKKIIENQVPVLGICFGHQILSKLNGGRVKNSKHREFGLANIYKKKESDLTKNLFKIPSQN